MSPVHGNQGQPPGRPAAPSQQLDQWGRPVAQPNAAYGQPGYPAAQAPAQAYPGYAPQAAPTQAARPQPAGLPSQGAQGYGPAYGQPDYGYAAQGQSAQLTAGNAAGRPAYAPQFEPFNPAPMHPQAQQPHHHQPQQAYQTPAPPAAPGHDGFGQHNPYPNQAAGYEYGLPAQHAAPQGHASHGYGAQPQQPAAQPHVWGPQHAQPDPRSFDLGTYSPAHQGYDQHAEPQFANAGANHAGASHTDWSTEGYGHETQYAQDPQQYGGEYAQGEYGSAEQGSDLGFAQAAGGELDQGYIDDDGQEYEAEPPSRFKRPVMMAAVLAGAIIMGGGMTYGYKALFSGPSAGDPPVVKSAAAPSKVKPADGGGKQFAHTDSKIMGRLGDGSSSEAGTDANGTRKVSTLIVGRDGSIQAPPAAEAEAAPPVASAGAVRVPGLTVVDGLGVGNRPPPQVAQVAAKVEEAVETINAPERAPPPQKPITVAKVEAPEPTGSIEPEVDIAPPPKKKTKSSAGSAPAPSTSVATTGSGFVAVLASVPRSGSSRMDALKRFADMQQKYASILTGKTPDVAEANLGAKGNYHRLVVGPPGSREQANSVCSQLKSQGYPDCWVTSY